MKKIYYLTVSIIIVSLVGCGSIDKTIEKSNVLFVAIDDLNELRKTLPEDPAPLMKTSQELQPHHTPPFASWEEYKFWLDNDKSYPALIKEYWNKK